MQQSQYTSTKVHQLYCVCVSQAAAHDLSQLHVQFQENLNHKQDL